MRKVTSASVSGWLVIFCGLFWCVHAFSQCTASYAYSRGVLSTNLSFSSTTSNASVTHLWKFGNPAMPDDTSANPTKSFPGFGTYYVSHVISGTNCRDSVGFPILINDPNSSPDTCMTSFETFVNHNTGVVSYLNTSKGTSGTYSWMPGYGSDTAARQLVRAYPNGEYRVCLARTNTPCLDTVCKTITVGCAADFTWWQDTTNGIVHFTNQLPPELQYNWTFGDLSGGTSALNTPSYHYTYNGKYYACLTTSTSDGLCQASFCDTIVVDYPSFLCQPYMSYTYDSANNYKVKFYSFISPEPANSYHWTLGDNQTASGQSPVHVYADTGSFRVCVTSRRFDGCISTKCDTIKINPQKEACGADFTFEFKPPVSNDDTARGWVQFTNYSWGDQQTYTWTFGDNDTSTVRNPLHYYETDGLYLVCLTARNNQPVCVDSLCQYIQVKKINFCNALFGVMQFADSTGGAKRIALFNNQSVGDSLTFLWTFGDGDTSTEQSPVHYYKTNGTYEVCLTVRGPNDSCSGVNCMEVNVFPDSLTGLKVLTDPGLDGINLFPVPFNDKLKVTFHAAEYREVIFEVRDVIGKSWKRQPVVVAAGNNEYTFDLSLLPSGVYFLELRSGKGNKSYKIIKQENMLK